MTFMNLDKNVVKQAAAGRWGEIFSVLAPQLRLAQAHPGKHCPCPVHGGTDGFRLFPDYMERGNGICNTCGPKNDGFQMLMWLNEWTFPEAIEKVGSYLGLKPEAARAQSLSVQQEPAEAVAPAPSSERANDDKKSDAYEGFVTFIGPMKVRRRGEPFTSFAIKVKDRIGRVFTAKGVDLKRCADAIKVKKGQYVRITKMGIREVSLSDGGKGYKILWNIEHLTVPVAKEPAPCTSEKQVAINRLWNAGRPLLAPEDTQSTPVEQYLLNRGIDLLSISESVSDSIRYLPSAYYRNEETGRTESYPAMLSAVRDSDGRLVTVHRTFLTPDGWKAPIATPKRLMALPEGSTISGAAIRLGKPEDVLCIAEGVETALSVMCGTGYPCWAAISANGMKDVWIPEGVKTVLIFADKDRTKTGAEAAETLRARLAQEGRLAVIVQIADEIPEGAKGLDWNDILRAKGVEAFPVKKPCA